MGRDLPGRQWALNIRGAHDAIAYAGGSALKAAGVVVAVTRSCEPREVRTRREAGSQVTAVIKGSYSATGASLNGRLLLVPSDIPEGTVTAVDQYDVGDGSVGVASAVHRRPVGSGPVVGPAQLLRGAKGAQEGIVVLAEAPRCSSSARLTGSLEALVNAAAEVQASEQRIFAERLRGGLQEREEERRRWARELHDETLQQMGALQVLLTSTLRTAAAPGKPDDVLPALQTATDMLNAQIIGLRHLITELRPATLDELGLSSPLHELARRTEELTGIAVEVHVSLRYADGQLSTRLLPDVEVAVYRVVQEALTNAARHSGATRVWISVVENDDDVRVEVADNGRGIRRPSTAPGFGITGMQERALLAGGRLQVLQGQGTAGAGSSYGTVIRLVVPAAHRVEEDPPVS